MWLVLALLFVASFIPYVSMGSIGDQLSIPPHPQGLKESLSSLHPAPPKEEALMAPVLLPLTVALLAVFCHTCGNGKYSAAHAAAEYLNQLYSQSQLSNFSQ